MKLEKRNKTGGRVKGTPNKITKDIRESYQLLIEKNLVTLETDLNKLNPKDRIEVLIKLSEFVIPKLQRSHNQIEVSELYKNLNIIGIEIED